MKRQIVILPAAENDLDDGRHFYEEQEERLGARFTATLIADIESLSVRGGVHRKVHGLHRSISKRFPYAIYYRVNADTVFVHRILDCRRDPDKLRGLLGGR